MELKDTASLMESPDYKERFKVSCSYEILREHHNAMGQYLHCLEIRAKIENVDL